MSNQDILNFLLIAAIWVSVGCLLFMTYYLIKTLKAITNLVDNLDQTTQGLKDKMQLKALAAVPAVLLALLGRILKRRR